MLHIDGGPTFAEAPSSEFCGKFLEHFVVHSVRMCTSRLVQFPSFLDVAMQWQATHGHQEVMIFFDKFPGRTS